MKSDTAGWVVKAEGDFKTLRLLMRQPAGSRPRDVACFHAQQCVEKYLV
jgi:HEPN domain-containing protein